MIEILPTCSEICVEAFQTDNFLLNILKGTVLCESNLFFSTDVTTVAVNCKGCLLKILHGVSDVSTAKLGLNICLCIDEKKLGS